MELRLCLLTGNKHNAQNYEAIRQLSNTGSQENLNAALIKSIELDLPPPHEQLAIADIGETWNREIDTTRNLITAKIRLKQGLMQQLLTGKRRFQEFNGEPWATVHLKDVTEECDGRNSGRLGTDAVKAVTRT